MDTTAWEELKTLKKGGFVPVLGNLLASILRRLDSLEEQAQAGRGAQPPATGSPTKVEQWGVQERAPITVLTDQSQPSRMVPASPVEGVSGCVHSWQHLQIWGVTPSPWPLMKIEIKCKQCGALMLFARTAAPLAEQEPSPISTYPKPDLSNSSGVSTAGEAMSGSESNERPANEY